MRAMKNSPRFILLDDDHFTLALTKKVIQDYNRRAAIISFSATKDAMAYFGGKDFIDTNKDTVLLTDLHMPELDGFSLLDQLEYMNKWMRERLHIFVLSAATDPDEIRKVFSYSYVVGFLNKPFSKAKMAQIITCVQYPL
jgi:response regulator of citrate/malate metabolism